MPTEDPVYDQLSKHVRDTAILSSIDSLLGWDERCLMPVRRATPRRQMTLLAGMIHDRQTDPRLGEWPELAGGPWRKTRQRNRRHDPAVETAVREEDQAPQSLVEELARTAVLGQQAWQEARRDDDFPSFARCWRRPSGSSASRPRPGLRECPYDALLDDYEPEELTANVARVLAGLRDELVPLVAEIHRRGRRPNSRCCTAISRSAVQEPLGARRQAIGFDFRAGGST